MNETGVLRSHGSRQDQTGLCHLDLSSPLLRESGCERRSVLAPEVQFPGQIQRRKTVVVPALWQGLTRNEVVVALLSFVEQGIAGHLGDTRRARALNSRLPQRAAVPWPFLGQRNREALLR